MFRRQQSSASSIGAPSIFSGSAQRKKKGGRKVSTSAQPFLPSPPPQKKICWQRDISIIFLPLPFLLRIRLNGIIGEGKEEMGYRRGVRKGGQAGGRRNGGGYKRRNEVGLLPFSEFGCAQNQRIEHAKTGSSDVCGILRIFTFFHESPYICNIYYQYI